MPLDAGNAFPFDPQLLAQEIDIPLEDWPLNCHGIACAVRDLVPVEGMRVVRGHYNGPVAHASSYRGGLQQHSWLELADGRILDPTRWAMQSPKTPFIYLGTCDHYDDGGRAMAAATPPAFPGTGPDFSRQIDTLPQDLRDTLAELLGRTTDSKALGEALYRKLKCDPIEIENPAGLYELAQMAGLKAIIPIDSWQRVMEPETIYCRPNGNRYFSVPEARQLSARDLVSELLVRFVSIEERGDRLESELAEHEVTLDGYHTALNFMVEEREWPLRIMDIEHQFILGLVIMDILGQGFGTALRVERFARSLGFDRHQLDAALREVTEVFGLDVGWI